MVVAVLLQIVGALRLAARGKILGLRAHILDLGKLERAVSLRLGERDARGVGVNVDLERLIVLADHKAVADAVQKLAERLDGAVVDAADDEHGVEGKGDVLVADGGEVRLVARGVLVLERGHGLAAQRREHSLQDHKEALAARVHNAGLLEHGIHVYGLTQRLLALCDGLLNDVLHAVFLGAGRHRAVRGEAGNGEDRALGRLHHRVVGSAHALLHGGGKGAAVRGDAALEALGHSAEEQRENDAGVAARAAQQSAGGDG